MDQDGSGGDGKDYDHVYILKVEIIGFAGRLNVGYAGKKRINNNTTVFYLSHRMEAVSICVLEIMGRVGFRGNIRSSPFFYTMTLRCLSDI